MLLLQAFLCGLAALIRFIDQNEFLVELIMLQSPCYEISGDGHYWKALWYYKTTYYVSAMVVGFALLGLTLCVAWCCYVCRRSQDGVRRVRMRGPPHGFYDVRCCCFSDAYTVPCSGDCGDCCTVCCEGRTCHCPEVAGPFLECTGPGSLIAVVIALALLGLFFALAALAVWIQKLAKRYIQLQQLRELSGEYVVQDLSATDTTPPQPIAPQQQLMEPSAPLPDAGDLEAQAPGSVMPVDVQRSVNQDLQAIYVRTRNCESVLL
jgi:hypothetical protein